jgi:hypothetical protein
MVLVSAATVRMIVTALLVASPDDVTSAPAIADFLTSIGGDTAMKTSRSMPSDPLPQIYPLVRDESEITGYRFMPRSLPPTAPSRPNGSVECSRKNALPRAAVSSRMTARSPVASMTAHCRPGKISGISGPECWQCVSAAPPRSWAALLLSPSTIPSWRPRAISVHGCSAGSGPCPPAPPSTPIDQNAFGRPRRSKRNRPPGVPIMSLSSGPRSVPS